MAFLKAQDTISGQEGKATFNIGDNVETGFFIKTFEANFEKNKTEIKTIGKRGQQHKSAGWNGTGSMNIYYVTDLFRKMALNYAKTGKDTYFTITVENDDPTSSVGKQTAVFYNCNTDNVVISKLDVDSEALDEDVGFTFDDFDILDQFGKPILG